MKKILSMTTVLVVLQFFVGCGANKPNIPTPQYTINKIDKVGFVIKSNKRMVHTHINTFSKFDKSYSKLITKELVSEMINTQIQAKLVDLENEKIEDINNLIIPKNNKWVIGSKKLYEKYIYMGLKAILVIEEKPVNIYLPPHYIEVKSSGFASTSTMGIHRYFGISGYTYSIILLDPIAKIDINKIPRYDILRDPAVSSFEEKSGLHNIQNFDKLSDKELAIIKDNILRITRENIIGLNNYLSN